MSEAEMHKSQCLEIAELRRLRLQQHLQLKSCEQDFTQVCTAELLDGKTISVSFLIRLNRTRLPFIVDIYISVGCSMGRGDM